MEKELADLKRKILSDWSGNGFNESRDTTLDDLISKFGRANTQCVWEPDTSQNRGSLTDLFEHVVNKRHRKLRNGCKHTGEGEESFTDRKLASYLTSVRQEEFGKFIRDTTENRHSGTRIRVIQNQQSRQKLVTVEDRDTQDAESSQDIRGNNVKNSVKFIVKTDSYTVHDHDIKEPPTTHEAEAPRDICFNKVKNSASPILKSDSYTVQDRDITESPTLKTSHEAEVPHDSCLNIVKETAILKSDSYTVQDSDIAGSPILQTTTDKTVKSIFRRIGIWFSRLLALVVDRRKQ